MVYKFKMTNDGWRYLSWIGRRYDAPDLFRAALTPTDDVETTQVYSISESDAWGIKEAYEEEGFPCLAWDSEFGKAVQAFIESIV